MQFWQSLLKKIKSAHPETDLAVGLVVISPREALHMFAQGRVHECLRSHLHLPKPPKDWHAGTCVNKWLSKHQASRVCGFPAATSPTHGQF